MEHLAPNSFLSDEAKRIWKPKTLGNKLPDKYFFQGTRSLGLTFGADADDAL